MIPRTFFLFETFLWISAKTSHDIMRAKGPFDQLNAEKELVSRYRFQIEDAQRGSQADQDFLAEEFDEIIHDLNERELLHSHSQSIKL